MTDIELFTSPLCPFAMRVKLVLAEKYIPATETEVDLDNKPARFLRLAPRGQVPLLWHRGAVVTESSVIAEYLDEAFPEIRLLPPDPLLRATARAWIRFIDLAIYGQTKLMLEAFGQPSVPVLAGKIAESLAVLEREAMAGHDGLFLLGADVTLADLTLYPWFEQLSVLESRYGFELPVGCRRLAAWRDAMAARRSVAVTCRPGGYYLAGYDALILKLNSLQSAPAVAR